MVKVGEKLGRYELLAELGRGASGLVLKARDTLLNDVVCIKLLLEGLAGDTATLERFKRELLIARKVTHPGVCKSFDLQTEGDHVFLVMEFVEGEALGHILDRTRPLPVQEAVRILRGACQALGAAHEVGIVHRDLKPGNILIRPDGRVCVVDFGIATSEDMEKLTRPGLVLGSQKYVAPERWSGAEADPRTDVWSLGIILYACVTGRLPYRGDGLFGVLDAIQQTTPPLPSSLNAEVPGLLDDVIQRALSVDPSNRFQDAKEMDEALSLLDMSGWVPSRGMTRSPKAAPPEPTTTVVVTPRDATLRDPGAPESSRGLEMPPHTGDSQHPEDHTVEGGQPPFEEQTAEGAEPSAEEVAPPPSAAAGEAAPDPSGPTIELSGDEFSLIPDEPSPPAASATADSDAADLAEDDAVAQFFQVEAPDTNPNVLPLRSQENRIPTVRVKRAADTLAGLDDEPPGRGLALALGAGAALVGVLIAVVFAATWESRSDGPSAPTPDQAEANESEPTGARPDDDDPTGEAQPGPNPGAEGQPSQGDPAVIDEVDESADNEPAEEEDNPTDDEEDQPAAAEEDRGDPEPDSWELGEEEPGATAGDETAASEPVERSRKSGSQPSARQARADRAEKTRYAAAKKALSRAMKEAGLLPGDDPKLDGLKARASQEARQGRYAAATAQLEKAKKRSGEVVVDRELVARKVQRLNRRYDGLKDEAKKREVADALRAVQKLFGKGDWRAANAKLNAALALLGSG